jgi:hypothetical protein
VPALRSLGGACALALRASLATYAGSLGMGNPSRIPLPKTSMTTDSREQVRGASLAEPGSARRPQAGADAMSATTARKPAHLQRCDHRLRGAGLRPATSSRSRRHVGCDGAKASASATVRSSLARSRAPPGDLKPEQTPCRLRRRESQRICNGAIIACAEPGSARRPQAGADAMSAATARKSPALFPLPPS